MPVVIVAPALPIGPGDCLITPPTRMILDFLDSKIPAYLDCGFNMVDVRDVAKGHILAAEYGCAGERYILGNENLTLSELLHWIEGTIGLTMPKRRIPRLACFNGSAIFVYGRLRDTLSAHSTTYRRAIGTLSNVL